MVYSSPVSGVAKNSVPFDRDVIDAQVALAEAVAVLRGIDFSLSDIEGGLRELQEKNSPGARRIRRAKKRLASDLNCLRRNFAVLGSRFIDRQKNPDEFSYASGYLKSLLLL